MTRLDAMLLPGEAVRFGAEKPFAWPGYIVLTVAAVLGLPVAALGIATAMGAIRPLPFVLVAGFACLVALIVLFAWLGVRAGPGLIVTDRRLVWRRGVLHRRALSLDLGEIEEAEAYAGNGVLRLHLADGGMRRIPWVDEPGSIARKLPCAVRIWPAHPEPPAPFSVRLLGMATVLLPFIFFELSRVFNVLMGIDETVQKTAVSGFIILISLFGSYLTSQASHIYARRMMEPDALTAFACWHLNPLSRGKEPWPETGGPWWVRFDRAYAGMIVRRFYGGKLDCRCEPETLEPSEAASATAVKGAWQ